MSNVTNLKTAEPWKVIAFRIGAQEFCADIMSVHEIRGWSPATPLPHSPDFVYGVINLRGVVLPIIDLSARFGFGATVPTAQHVIIVAQARKRTFGLLVDAVTDIVTVNDDLIQPTPNVTSELGHHLLRGVLVLEGRMISVVALDEIAPEDEREVA